MSSEKVKLAIADDHPLFRAALVQATLKSLPASEVVEATTFDELVEVMCRHQDIELLFLDINMPGNEGFAGLSQIRNSYPDVQIIMVSALEDAGIMQRAIALGASAYIPKSAALDDIAHAITVVLNGETWLPQNITLTVSHAAEEKALADKLERLTPAQFNVLRMISDGLLNKQIAYEMNIQETTVKQHVSAVLQKLSVNNRTQAGIIYQQLKFIDNNTTLAK